MMYKKILGGLIGAGAGDAMELPRKVEVGKESSNILDM